MRPELGRQVLGEADEPVLGRDIARHRGAAQDRHDRRDIDDAAVLARQHVPPDLARSWGRIRRVCLFILASSNDFLASMSK